MVNVSIVTYHTAEDELHACLRSFIDNKNVGRIDIIDNGSEERLAEFFQRNYPERVNYIPNNNTGYGAAHNIAMRLSIAEDADYHLVLNSDVYFEPSALDRCIAYMDANPSVGQLIPAVTFPDGSYQPVCHPLPSPWDLIAHRFIPRSLNRKARDRYEMRCYDLSKPLNVPYHHGCFLLMRCAALSEVGLFDERFFMYPEDIDITRRIHASFETIYYPEATIVHAHRAESRTNYRLLWIHIVNMLRYFAKWGFFIDPERRRINRALRSRLTPKQ